MNSFMAAKKTNKKTTLVQANKPVSIRLSDSVARSIIDNDRCSCGGHIWSYIVDGRIVRKCGDCGYVF